MTDRPLHDLLGGSYDCVDRSALNTYFRMGDDLGGFRVSWRASASSPPGRRHRTTFDKDAMRDVVTAGGIGEQLVEQVPVFLEMLEKTYAEAGGKLR
jgi:hypothetical protein